MHGNQVCVPDATLLPAGIDRIHPAGPRMSGTEELRYCATERSRDGDNYVYDIALRDRTGAVVERWEGLRLRAVRKNDARGPWAAPLLGSYLERAVGDLLGARVAVAVEPDPTGPPDADGADLIATRRAHTALAAGRAFGHPVEVRYRPDGRPEVDGDRTVSSAHGAGLTLGVAGAGALGCDVELAAPRPVSVWQSLLGPHFELAELIAQTSGESADIAGTRVWAAVECLQKAGRTNQAPLALLPSERAGWTLLSSGELRIAVFVTTVRDVAGPVAFAILTEGR